MTLLRHFRILWLVMALLATGWVRAEVLTLNPEVKAQYVVKRGDTLWDIAEYYLREPWKWPQLWQVNQQIGNPHLIYPGDVLELSWVDGKPRLGLSQETVEARLSPRVRREPLDQAIPPIPLDEIKAFLNGPRVITNDEWKKAPYILAFADDRLLGADGVPVYARNIENEAGLYWQVFHRGQKIRDLQSGRTLGYEGIPVGELELRDYGNPAEGQMIDVHREVLRGDRLFKEGAPPLPGSFAPRAPEGPIDARIIATYDNLAQIGQYQIAAVNLGRDDDMEPGYVLGIQQAGAEVIDPGRILFREVELPPVQAATMMLFDVGEELSYGLIVHATRSISKGDKVTEPRY